MTPDERELRRALDARSGVPTPAFRARLSVALAASGGPARHAVPPIAVAAACFLAVITVTVLLLIRHLPSPEPGRHRTGLPAGSTPSAAGPTATPLPTPNTSPTVSSGRILPNIAQFDAPSPSIVWALVGRSDLFRSTDRGQTWQQRPLPSSAGIIQNVSFVDGAQGWLLATGSPATQCSAEVASIWHTVDAGATWQLMDTNGIAAAQCKSSLSFVDPDHGFLVGADWNHRPVIYRTADGGQTWLASQLLPDPPGFTSSPGGFTLGPGPVSEFGSTLLVEASGTKVNGGPVHYVFRSTNGGASWIYMASAPGEVAFVTATRWLMLESPGYTQETIDAGGTWHAYPSDYDQAAPIAPAVVFADPVVGYATVRGSLKRTDDGGLHWDPVNTPGT